ncbi:MAG TPA: hypothetical protein VFI27_20965 [candidate division Zixibacteria bacterium]|nr:hypothetical protein [candidate division Zixibacteria bacterium]
MCCLITILVLLGPRVASVIWWILDTSRWSAAFGSIIWPILGIIFVPWTTLMYVLVTANDAISGLEVVFLMIALVVDVMTLGGGGFGNRKRFTG